MRISAILLCALATSFATDAAAQRGSTAIRTSKKLGPGDSAPSILPITHARQKGSYGGQVRGGERPAIVMMGYWPPSNEMLRRFSDDAVQNPSGWIGSDWESRGYDVYSYFPEFTPPNCSNCGKGDGDLEVDYQDTSNDFWPLIDALNPVAVITFSRGWNDMSWELEMNQYNRIDRNWINDYVAPLKPTPAPPDDSVPDGALRLSQLPVQDIVDNVNNAGLGLNSYICWSGDGGGFLSEFLAYHGVWYQGIHESAARSDWCIAGGHVHVGGQISWPTATTAAEITLRTVTDYVDSVIANTVCQNDVGFGGPGTATLKVCGDALAPGGLADLLMEGAAASTTAILFASPNFAPTPFKGGHIVPFPPTSVLVGLTDPAGEIFFPDVAGGGGPVTAYAQFLYVDLGQPLGVGFSNGVEIEFLK